MDKDNEVITQIFKDFIQAFVQKDRRDRILQFLDKKKRWPQLTLVEFHHSGNFDEKVLVDIKPNEQYASMIYKHMQALGAGDKCFSLLDYLNGENYECGLEEKLKDTVGSCWETILYCPDSNVGYFEGGHAKDRYILKRS